VSEPGAGTPVDFDLHGLAGIRVVGATPAEARAVERVVGPFRRTLERPADITVRFVDDLPLAGARLVGVDDAAFDERAFYVLAGPRHARVAVRLPVENIGGRCEIVCRRGAPGLPYLREILNLTVLANGGTPVHAAAFELRGEGTLVTGWSRGGKTEILLAAMAAGARYVGDDWVYVDAAGNRLHGTLEPITLWDRDVRDLAVASRVIRRRKRAAMRAVQATTDLARRTDRGGARRVAALLERRGSVRVPPDALFGSGACLLESSFDRLLLGVSHAAGRFDVMAADPLDVARRMAPCLIYEHREVLALRHKFQFAFPDAASPVLDDLEHRLTQGLLRSFGGKEAHVIAHPYPAPVPVLRASLRELL
jgi:hypothetical protein